MRREDEVYGSRWELLLFVILFVGIIFALVVIWGGPS